VVAVDPQPNGTYPLETPEPTEATLPRASAFGAATAALSPARGVVVALVPAHNEEDEIEAAVRSLNEQDSPPDLIVVIADNCTDRTAERAEAAGAYVFETTGNVHKKAGALNQVLDLIIPVLHDEDAVLVMDADSRLAPTFLVEAMRRLRDGVGGVGGVFTGRSGGGLVGMLQRNEYARYARDVARMKGRVLVLTGTATLFSAPTLRHVLWARAEGLLPGGTAQVYDTNVLTEDNELTLALLHLGYRVVSPKGCRLTTEVMPTWRDLYRQRLRWKRGAIENIRDYGLTRVTAGYWGRQLFTLAGIVVTLLYLVSLGWSLATHGTFELRPLWLAVTGLFVVERVITVRSRGLLQMAVAATLLVEMAYDLFLQTVHLRAIWDALVNNERKW
jgi:cellulose synthase/poly-beta-1,6-N-acetylglucosamine synthase-like glycosyltransferase